MGLMIAVVDPVPVFRQGLVAVLTQAGHRVQEPEDALAWALGCPDAPATTAEAGHRTAASDASASTITSVVPGRPPTSGEGATPISPRAVVLRLHGDEQWALLRRLHARAPTVPVVALLPGPDCVDYVTAPDEGAASALAYDAPGEEITAALRAAVAGRTRLPTPIAHTMAAQTVEAAQTVAWATGSPATPRQVPNLDECERAWLRALAGGTTVECLAREQGLAPRTMYTRLKRVYHRLGADSRAEALALAGRLRLLDPDDDHQGAMPNGSVR